MASYDEALAYVLKSFGVNELKTKQKLILNALMESKDCVGILPTGYGKSLPYQLVLPLKRALKTDSSGEKIIVCCPCLAIMQGQVKRLNTIQGVTAAFKGHSVEMDENIYQDKFDYLFGSPENLVGNKEFRNKIEKYNVSTIAVDEFLIIVSWGLDNKKKEAFRKWFREIGEMRSLFPQASIVALSATCTHQISH